MRFDPDLITQALASAGPWSLPSTFASTEVHHGYRRVVVVNAGVPLSGGFDFILDHFAPVFDAWLSWIDPGGFIVPHHDASPYRERWQIPLRPAGEFPGGTAHQQVGVPFQVSQWATHAVWNDTDGPRVHLVIDRDITLERPPQPFQTFDVPPGRVAMVERSLHG